nr:hypothetical protein [Treponemataceae bacterium]
TYYTDFIEAWFQGYEARAALEFNFTENLSFLIRIKGTYLPDAIGDDYWEQPPDLPFQFNAGYKGGLSAWSVSGASSIILKI